MAEIVKRLDSKDSLEREQAAEQLRQVLAQDLDHIKRNRQFQWGFSIAWFMILTYLQFYYLSVQSIVGYACITGMGLCTLLGTKSLAAVFQRRVAHRIATLDTPHVIGPLIDALATSGLFWNREIRQALIRFLPRLQASDAALLNSRQRKYLSRFLIVDE